MHVHQYIAKKYSNFSYGYSCDVVKDTPNEKHVVTRAHTQFPINFLPAPRLSEHVCVCVCVCVRACVRACVSVCVGECVYVLVILLHGVAEPTLNFGSGIKC